MSFYCSQWRQSQCGQLSHKSFSTAAHEQLYRVHLHVIKMSADSLKVLETPPCGCLNSSFLLCWCNHPDISAQSSQDRRGKIFRARCYLSRILLSCLSHCRRFSAQNQPYHISIPKITHSLC